MLVLEVQDLLKVFETKKFIRKKELFIAINRISFALKEGEILGFLGPNGAGKTTVIQMLLGLLTPTSGSIRFFGKDLLTHRSEIIHHVSFVSPYLKLPGSLSVAENLQVYSLLYDIPASLRMQRIEKNLRFFELWDMQHKLTKTLSAGQLTRLMLAKAFLPNPKIVLLDEPTAALDPDIAIQVRNFILEERKRLKISVIITSHNMTEVEELCDRVLVLKAGTIIADETPKQLTATIKTSHLQLFVINIEHAIKFATEYKAAFKVDGQFIEFEVDEQKIPELLYAIMQSGLSYTEISIKKPTLEDYFLSIAAKKNSHD